MSTPLEIIKSEIAKINEARSKTSFVPKEKWSFDDDSTTIDCPECGSEVESPGYILKSADEHQVVDIHLYGMERICKPQAEFIALAANRITQLTEALTMAVEGLVDIAETDNYNTSYLGGTAISEDVNKSLSKIAEILTGCEVINRIEDKVECKHEPTDMLYGPCILRDLSFVCKHCGIELKTIWSKK